MTKIWLSLAGLAGGALLVYLLAPVLTPFLAAALFAYLGNPLVNRLEARNLSHALRHSDIRPVPADRAGGAAYLDPAAGTANRHLHQ